MNNDDKIIKDITKEERNFLLYFKSRPGMYIGNNSIIHAHTFLLGYKSALYNLNQTDSHCIIPDEFTEYTALKYNESSSMGWCQIILKQAFDEEKALWLFFDLLDEFLVINGFEPIGETSARLWYRLRNCICRKEIFDNIDISKIFKRRNLHEFQIEWNRVRTEIEAVIKNNITSDNIKNAYYHKNFYKNIIYDDVYELCENKELAEIIAKDIDMIYAGNLVGYNDNLLNMLTTTYKQYKIP